MIETTSRDLLSQAKSIKKKKQKKQKKKINALLQRALQLCEYCYDYDDVAEAYIELLKDSSGAERCYQMSLQNDPDQLEVYLKWATMVVLQDGDGDRKH